MKKKFFPFLFFTMILFFYSCRKGDLLPPSLKIILPVEESIYNVNDSIGFHFIATDDRSVKKVSVLLLDKQNRMVGKYRNFYSSKNSLDISDYYPVNDTTLTSDYYFLKFIASDGENETHKSVRIKINGFPQITLGLLAVIENSSIQTSLYLVDTNFVTSFWDSYPANFLDARIDNRYRRLYLFPKSYGVMSAVNLDVKNVEWTLPRISTLSPEWFRGIELIDHILFVGDYNSTLTLYDQKGAVVGLHSALFHYTVNKMLKNAGNTFLYQLPIGYGQHKRISVYNFGMNLIQNIIFDYELIAWFPKDDQNITLFYNSETGMHISNFYYSLAGITNILTKNEIQLNDVEQITQSSFLLATNQGIYYFDIMNINSFSKVVNRDNVTNIKKNEMKNLYVGTSGNEIFTFTLPDGNILNTAVIGNEVKKVFWLYNR